MENITLTLDELNKMPKNAIALLYIQMSESFTILSAQSQKIQDQNERLIHQIEDLQEQIAILTQQRFGKRTETDKQVMGQLSFSLENMCVLNEAEALVENGIPDEPDIEKVVVRRKRTKGKRDLNLQNIEVEVINHDCSEEELREHFPKGWHPMEDEVYKELQYIPARFKVLEHHIKVYAGNSDCGSFLRAKAPERLLAHSILTPELAAAVFNAKYVNAVPLYRLEKEFERYGLAITRQNMANWMIRLGEEYLGTMYDYLHKLLYDYHVIQADETPVLVNKDGRPAGSQSYMWVYRSGFMYRDRQIILYEYQKTRNASHPREFLRDYTGICVTDGYQVYHTLEKERENLKIAGCWVHCRRRFNDALEVIPKAHRKESILHLIMKQIQAIYREEGKLSDFSTEDRLMQRQLVVKPLVDAFFAYLKQNEPKIPKNGKIREAFTYALNQESYLKVFLEDGDVPIDNNASERAIRGFCIGKKNWEMIDTVNGANSSAIIYSIAETAKANNLKPFDYFEYLLTEIPKHVDDKNIDFLAELLPWSDMLPENIRKPQKASGK